MIIFSDNTHLFNKYELGKSKNHTFPSGEFYSQFLQNVRGEDVFLVADMSLSANDCLMKLLVQCDAAKRASANYITAVLPYFFYSRQDRKDKSRTPISARLVMDLLEAAGFHRIITMDLHNPAIQGMTNLPCDNLFSEPLLYEWFKQLQSSVEYGKEVVVGSPDMGGIKRSSAMAELLGVDFVYTTKHRKSDTVVEVKTVTGDVKSKVVVLVDDLTESLGTLEESAKTFLHNGADAVWAFTTHSPLTEVGLKRLDETCLKGLISTNTFNRSHPKLTQLDVSGLFFQAIEAVGNNSSVSSLFKVNGF